MGVSLLVVALLGLYGYCNGAEYYGELWGSLETKEYGVSGDVYVVDNHRLQIRGFSYTGKGPDAYFYVGLSGDKPSADTGRKIPNEMGSEGALGKYENKNIVLNLMSNIEVSSLVWFSVWCKNYKVDFGSFVKAPPSLIPAEVDLASVLSGAHQLKSGTITLLDQRRVLIRDLKYDGLGPDAFFWGRETDTVGKNGFKIPNENGNLDVLEAYNTEDVTITLPAGYHWGSDSVRMLSLWCIQHGQDFGHVLTNGEYDLPPYIEEPGMSVLANCEMMNDYLNAAWEIIDDRLVVELMGTIDQDTGYMAFGIGGDSETLPMVGADVAVASFMDNNKAKVEDYYLQSKAFCSGQSGSCPDSAWGDSSQLQLINSWRMNHVSTVRFSRPLISQETQRDRSIVAGSAEETVMVWAIGNLNAQGRVTKHTERGFKKLALSRAGMRDCRAVKKREDVKVEGWPTHIINTAKTPVIEARIGPPGGPKGFQAITGIQPWGIAWYLNGLLIPTVVVQRGSTITFKVYGGNNKNNPAEYHPFYITNDHLGAYETKSLAEKDQVEIYAGPKEGPHCSYDTTANSKAPETYAMFEQYFETLKLNCMEGEPGILTWTPDMNTPDDLYYQCYTHQNLGWKIKVVDDIDEYLNAASSLSTLHIVSLLVVSLLGTLLML